MKKYDSSMHNFNVAIVDYSYMFQLPQSNHQRAV